MPITVATLAVTPYQVGSVNVPNSQAAPPLLAYTGPVKHRGVHTIYTLANSRINLNINPPNANNALARLSGAQSATGNAVYLKYFDEEITSVRLPYPAPAGLVFFTDNMSGCKFYVDSINGSNDLIVYHANTHQHNPGPIRRCRRADSKRRYGAGQPAYCRPGRLCAPDPQQCRQLRQTGL